MIKPSKKSLKKKLQQLWSKKVIDRDKECMMKGFSDCKGPLQAHHAIIRAGQSLSTRFEPRNGICLCQKHHIFGIHGLYDFEFLSEYNKRLCEKITEEERAELKLKSAQCFKDSILNLQELISTFI